MNLSFKFEFHNCLGLFRASISLRTYSNKDTKNKPPFHVLAEQRTAKKCTKIYIARAQPLFYSLNQFVGGLLGVAVVVCLKWYYDQKIISFFSSDFESLFAKHPTGKILSFVFYPKAVYFECKFWISRSAITHVQN